MGTTESKPVQIKNEIGTIHQEQLQKLHEKLDTSTKIILYIVAVFSVLILSFALIKLYKNFKKAVSETVNKALTPV